METTQKIILNNFINKKSVNTNESVSINLSGNKKMLPEDSVSDSFDGYDVYLEERSKSNKFRLIININPYCTNVLFNPFTEIIKDEGSDDVICLNYEKNYTSDNVIGKDKNFVWNQYEAIRDTQLSNAFCGFDYKCGIDIFNNHILRNKSFKSVNFSDKTNIKIKNLGQVYGLSYNNVKVNQKGVEHQYCDKNFNTIDDYMRDRNGVIISERFPKFVTGNTKNTDLQTFTLPLHLYQDYDIRSFKGCIGDKLIEDNGWFGFKNPSIVSSMLVHREDSDEPDYNLLINKTINNKKYCEFIDMYPGRDLYSFFPKYNEYRNRLEKNWNYCLTYPSENIIEQFNGESFPFFRIDENKNVSLRVLMFDDYTVDDNGTVVLTVYSIARHGLMVGDTVNIYKGNEIFYDSAEVLNVVDNFIFQVKKDTGNMSDEWVFLDEDDTSTIYTVDGKKYPVCASKRCNVDTNAQDIHFRRVVNGVECKYYVRKFSRLPNFKFKDAEINDYTLYDENYINENGSLIKRFSTPTDDKNNFESHLSKLGFAETAYGDDVVELVYTDNIDTSYLRDNLGRPLSDIYLTIVKNNKGYKDWYGIDNEIKIKNNPDIEYSHCFGKVNSSFLLSDYYLEYCEEIVDDNDSVIPGAYRLKDVRLITCGPKNGIKCGLKNSNNTDEIFFDKDLDFYGDICCYSPIDCEEEILQKCMNRFNTAQRELDYYEASSISNFNDGIMYYNEINEDDVENNLMWDRSNEGDPYDKYSGGTDNPKSKSEISPSDTNLYHTTREKIADMLKFPEGYYYQTHYKIPLKTVSQSLSSDPAIKYVIYEINNVADQPFEDKTLFEIKLVDGCNFSRNEKVVMYKKSTNEYFFVTVYSLLSDTDLYCLILDENGNYLSSIDNFVGEENVNDYVFLKKNENTPYYARLIKDGSCRYCWREVKSNGMENEDKIYPFTNGAFYITKQINFFLRRQDPNRNKLSRSNSSFNYTYDGEFIGDYYDNLDELNYYDSEEIKEC